ncbi:MAG: hypothetical protein KKA79_10770 [Nanoarchaeota archaeon]|nr:hypothetical protein [Nanoarchaeota archaeon]MCG2717422.1 hypothetical protein [Nanoarchaeota archaeon]
MRLPKTFRLEKDLDRKVKELGEQDKVYDRIIKFMESHNISNIRKLVDEGNSITESIYHDIDKSKLSKNDLIDLQRLYTFTACYITKIALALEMKDYSDKNAQYTKLADLVKEAQEYMIEVIEKDKRKKIIE